MRDAVATMVLLVVGIPFAWHAFRTWAGSGWYGGGSLRYIRLIFTVTKAGLAAALPLLSVLIGARISAAQESSPRDSGAIGWTVFGVVAVIILVPAALILVNRTWLSGARERRQSIERLSGVRWLADVTVDAHSRERLGLSEDRLKGTFALVSTPTSLELWATGSGPSLSLERTYISRTEAVSPPFGARAIAFELNGGGGSEPVVLDIVGQLYGVLPATMVLQRTILDELIEASGEEQSVLPTEPDTNDGTTVR